MRRREFVTLLGSAAAAWPLAARAQQQQRVRRLSVFLNLPESDPEFQARMGGLRQALEKLGWTEGRNIRIDHIEAGSADRFSLVAKEMVALSPDVILTGSGPVTAAVQRETRSIPIVFTATSDPVGGGLVGSLAHPGGNITGFLLYEASITGKWLAMLKEIAPQLTRVALVGNPRTVPFDYYLHEGEAIAPSLGLEVVPTRIGRVEDGRGGLGHAATPRFPSPLIEPDVRISRIRLSDWLHREAHGENGPRAAFAWHVSRLRLTTQHSPMVAIA
jgi:putative tryptophan/tyrosine transport system substrate-binding protein